MPIRVANLQTALIVLLSVIALFFFPAPRGSFVATHGPMTALCTYCGNALLRVRTGLDSLSALPRRLSRALAALDCWLHPSALGFSAALELRGFSILRI